MEKGGKGIEVSGGDGKGSCRGSETRRISSSSILLVFGGKGEGRRVESRR